MVKEKNQKTIIIGLPAYNEEKLVAGVILQAKEYADKVIVVDDGSTDRTARVSRLAGAEVVEHKSNMGYGSSIRTLLDEARTREADILVIIDADGQHNPDEIPHLIDEVNNGADLVIGSRKHQRDATPGYRWLGQKVLTRFTNIASGQKLSDTESGFRAYSRKAINELNLKETGMAISAEMISVASQRNLVISEVPVSVSYEEASSSQNPVVHGLSNLNRIFIFISERRPLLFFSIIGGILILAGVGAGISVVLIYYDSYAFATGTALLCMLLVTLGVLCIFTGVILSVLTRRLNQK